MTSVVGDILVLNTEPGDNLIEYEICCHLTIGFKGRHFLFPLQKVFNNEREHGDMDRIAMGDSMTLNAL